MSSGGSNYSTGTTGNGPMTARIESPISKGPNAPQGGMSVPVDNFSSPAPGGKGGFPSAQNPYAQQQPQMYMPPQQPSMYQQAFPQQQQRSYVQSDFYAPQQQYGGNAYARPRPYSPQTPIEASPPPSEMNYAPGGLEQAPQQLMSDSWSRRRMIPDDFQPLRQPGPYVGPTNEVGQFGGPGPTDPSKQMNYALGRFDSNAPKPMPESNGPILSYPGGSRNWNQQFEGRRSDYQISEIPYQGEARLTPPRANLGGGLGGMPKQTVDPYQGSYQISEIPYRGEARLTPVAAAQGVRPEPNYSGGLGSLMSGMSGSMQVPAASQDVVNRKLQALNQGFGAPAQPLDWINTPNGRLWNA